MTTYTDRRDDRTDVEVQAVAPRREALLRMAGGVGYAAPVLYGTMMPSRAAAASGGGVAAPAPSLPDVD